jgi:Mrp family chromosome partitioning ATPase
MIASVRMRGLTTKAAAAAAAGPMRLTRGLKNKATAAELLPDVKRKIVVLSGKGGVGKSTLAARAFSLFRTYDKPLASYERP